MEDRIRYIELYDQYSKLLTEKQQTYFEEYYYNNLSLQEISELYNVSRNAVFKTLKDVTIKLDDFESKLMLLKKQKEIKNILEEIEDKELKERVMDVLW